MGVPESGSVQEMSFGALPASLLMLQASTSNPTTIYILRSSVKLDAEDAEYESASTLRVPPCRQIASGIAGCCNRLLKANRQNSKHSR